MNDRQSAPCPGRGHHGPTLTLDGFGTIYGRDLVSVWLCDSCGARATTIISKPDWRSFWEGPDADLGEYSKFPSEPDEPTPQETESFEKLMLEFQAIGKVDLEKHARRLQDRLDYDGRVLLNRILIESLP